MFLSSGAEKEDVMQSQVPRYSTSISRRNEHSEWERERDIVFVANNFPLKYRTPLTPRVYLERNLPFLRAFVPPRERSVPSARLDCENLIDRKVDNPNLTKLPRLRSRGTSLLPPQPPLFAVTFSVPPFLRRRRLGFLTRTCFSLPRSRQSADVATLVRSLAFYSPSSALLPPRPTGSARV